MVGFGTGHYYLGDDGTPFLIGNIIGLGGMVGGYVYELASIASITYSSSSSVQNALTGTYIGLGVVVVGAGVYLASHIWEVVAIFGAADRARRDGRVAELTPVFNVRRTSCEPGISPSTSFEMGLSLRY